MYFVGVQLSVCELRERVVWKEWEKKERSEEEVLRFSWFDLPRLTIGTILRSRVLLLFSDHIIN